MGVQASSWPCFFFKSGEFDEKKDEEYQRVWFWTQKSFREPGKYIAIHQVHSILFKKKRK